MCSLRGRSKRAAKKTDFSVVANSDEFIELRHYYYGEILPQDCDCCESRPLKRKRARSKLGSEMDVHIKCTVCPKLFKKNSEIIPHIFEHIDTDDDGNYIIRHRRRPLKPSKLRCRICMKKTLMDNISSHTKNSHEMRNHKFTCRICELYFDDKLELIKHMHLTHPCLDMPYNCAICGYKTSFRTLIFTHFEEFHLKNHVMCNFCLIILPVSNTDELKPLEAHMMQHARSGQPKCSYCTLRFTCQENLQDHLRYNHHRLPDCTQVTNIKWYELMKGEDSIFMKFPRDKNPRVAREARSRALASHNCVQQCKPEDTDSDDDLQIICVKLGSRQQDPLSLEGSNLTNLSSRPDNIRCVPYEFLDALGLRPSEDILLQGLH